MESMERGHKMLSRMLPGLVGISYKERLGRLELCSLGRYRSRGDLMDVCNTMRHIDRVRICFPRVEMTKTRGHNFVRRTKLEGNLRAKCLHRWWEGIGTRGRG